jgi:hypothetical protein
MKAGTAVLGLFLGALGSRPCTEFLALLLSQPNHSGAGGRHGKGTLVSR